MIDTIGGQAQIYFTGMTAALPQVKTGKLRALGVTTRKRSPAPLETRRFCAPRYWGLTPVSS